MKKYITEIADRIRTADVWDGNDCLKLIAAAGMLREWADCYDDDSFSAVVEAAANKLGVKIH